MPTTTCTSCNRSFSFKPKPINFIGGVLACLVFFPALLLLIVPFKRDCPECGAENKAPLMKLM